MRKIKATGDSLANISAALVAKLKADAERDAEDVVRLVRSAEAQYRAKYPDRPLPGYPPESLLGLRVAMRFRRWERCGVPIHLAIGLPSSTDVMRFVTTHMHGPRLERFVGDLSTAVFKIVHDHLLWMPSDSQGRGEIVISGEPDEETLIDAVVDLILRAALRRAG